MSFRICVCLFFLTLLVIGCGGGGGGGGSTPQGGSDGGSGGSGGGGATVGRAFLTLAWPERTRATETPTSALSVKVRLVHPSSPALDRSIVVDRDGNQPHDQVVSLSDVPTGSYTAMLNFHGEAGGQGVRVATAAKAVSIKAGDNDLGDFTTVGDVAQVVVPGGQKVKAGSNLEIAFTALRDNGAVIAVSRGSSSWTVNQGAQFGNLTPDGVLTGTAKGVVKVTVSVDGKSSQPQDVAVLSPVSVSLTPNNAEVEVSTSIQFTAKVSGTTDASVTWQVIESGGGSVNNAGFYTAPSAVGTYHVKVTSSADPDQTATSVVNVVPPPQGSVTGTVYAPDGLTPIFGASLTVTQPTSPVQTTSAADGRFTLGPLSPGSTTIKIVKGEWVKSFTIDVPNGGTVEATKEQTTLPSNPSEGAPKIAVVAGAFDKMENVLAKLGLGSVDLVGNVVPSTAKFDMIDFPFSTMTWGGLVSDTAKLNSYDIVIVNCGADIWQVPTATITNNLRQFVEGGGKFYVTDLSYDLVEQTFPNAIDFLGSDEIPTELPEHIDGAEWGDGGITPLAQVHEQALASWLSTRGALTPPDLVQLTGFLGGWAVIDTVHADTKTWVSGHVSYTEPFSAPTRLAVKPHEHQSEQTRAVGSIKPLTVTFERGTGRVLFTSYHTEHEPSVNLRPQEWILGYLLFEL